MTIIDNERMTRKLTDLKKAIRQADYYRRMQHNPATDYDKIRKAYWKEIYSKLILLQNKTI